MVIDVVTDPLGFTEPFSVAVVAVLSDSADVITEGGAEILMLTDVFVVPAAFCAYTV
jgi:hypothetical protein